MNVLQKTNEVKECECQVCKLVKDSINNKKCRIFYETNEFILIEPIIKSSSSHLVVVTKKHIEQNKILSQPKIFKNINKKIDEFFPSGWRIIINYGRDSSQVEKHAHFHILGKQNLLNIGFL